MATELLRCLRCGQPGNARGCQHAGEWHASFSDCGPSCALGLGWNNLGTQHWGCCFSTKRDSTCRKRAHIFEEVPVAGPAAPAVAAKMGAALFGRSECRRFRVNLDEAPETRWLEVINAYRDQLPAAMEMIDGVLGTGLSATAASTVFSGMTKLGGVHFGQELQAIADAMGIGVGKVAIMQVAYEVFAACTSIVVDVTTDKLGEISQGADEKRPFHIRTMDWDFQQLQALTIEVDFLRGGRTLFSCTTWPGYVGVMTGVKPGAFSVSVNYRRTPQGAVKPIRGIMENMLRGFRQHWPVSFLVREVLQTATSYAEAVGNLSASELMAPTYIIMAGTKEGEGIVLTRGRKGQNAEPGAAAGGDADAEPPIWLLSRDGPVVQANMDHWRDDAREKGSDWQDIEYSVLRRAVARQAIASCGEAISPEDLWLLMSTSPCRADDTVYTTAMCPATGHLCTRAFVSTEQEVAGKRRWGKVASEVKKSLRGASGREGGKSGPSRRF